MIKSCPVKGSCISLNPAGGVTGRVGLVSVPMAAAGRTPSPPAPAAEPCSLPPLTPAIQHNYREMYLS